MDKALGRWLGGRLFLSAGKRKQGLDKAAGTMGIEGSTESGNGKEVKSVGLQ